MSSVAPASHSTHGVPDRHHGPAGGRFDRPSVPEAVPSEAAALARVAAAAPQAQVQAPTQAPVSETASKGKPVVAMTLTAKGFALSRDKTHSWLDAWLNPSDAKSGKANTWSVVVKRPTKH
ncbi:MAG: hypothetical protein ACHQK9_25585, partial [Reyranellales bacterium]